MSVIEPVEVPVPELRNLPATRLALREELALLGRYRHLLANLVRRDLTVRYKRSVLGLLWTMLNPLLMMVILTVVFSTLFRFEIRHYETYFLSAYLGWVFFSQTTVGAMSSLGWNGPLVKRVRIPKSIFALSTTVSGAVNLLLSLAMLAAIMAVLGMRFAPALLFLPVSILLLTVFTFGVALGVSSVAVYFTDVREMYQIAMMIVMYLTPILYPASIVPARYRLLVDWNPLTALLSLLREPIYYGQLPTAAQIVASVIWAVVALVAGWGIFRRLATGFHVYM